MGTVFEDPGVRLADFFGDYLVRCPRCGKKARVDGMPHSTDARMVCTACGLVKQGSAAMTAVGVPSDPCLCLPLWLQTSCTGHTLWAYNARHLTFLESFISAKLRQTNRNLDRETVRGLLSRELPDWMTAAKNRDKVVRGLASLRRLSE